MLSEMLSLLLGPASGAWVLDFVQKKFHMSPGDYNGTDESWGQSNKKGLSIEEATGGLGWAAFALWEVREEEALGQVQGISLGELPQPLAPLVASRLRS